MPKTPAYRQRSGDDQAIVTITDSATKQRRDCRLETRGAPASREMMDHRVIAPWEAAERRLPGTPVELEVLRAQ